MKIGMAGDLESIEPAAPLAPTGEDALGIGIAVELARL
jgi:hypothetical protein